MFSNEMIGLVLLCGRSACDPMGHSTHLVLQYKPPDRFFRVFESKAEKLEWGMTWGGLLLLAAPLKF